MANYFMATTGNDGNVGDIDNPWLTHSKAMATMVAGDTLHIRGGDYTPTVGEDLFTFDVSGTSTDYVEIKAYDGGGTPEPVWFDGQFTYPSAVNINGLTPAQGNLYGTSYDTNYKGLISVYADYVKLTNINVKNSKGRGLEFESLDPGTKRWHDLIVTNMQILDPRHAGITMEYTDYITLTNVALSGAGSYAPYLRPIVKATADTLGTYNHPAAAKFAFVEHLTIDGLISHDQWGEGCNLSSHTRYYTVKNCKIYNTMSPLLYLHRSRDGEIYNNEIYWTTEGFTYGTENHGIYVQNEDAQPGETMIAGDLLIYNNLVANCRSGIITGGGNGGQFGFDNVGIYHNQLINNVQFQIQISNRPPLTNIEIANNIMYDNGIGDLESVPSHPEISIHHNAWSATPSVSARGAGDVYGDPKLRNPDAALSPGALDYTNYQKLGTSPAIFAGVAIPGITTDATGATRATPPDMGFDEFSPASGGGGGPGSSPVALAFGVAQALAPASTGTTTLTDANFGGDTPKAALVFANFANSITSGRAARDHASLSIGVTDGTTEGVMGLRMRDGQTTTDVRARGSAANTALLLKNASTSVAAALAVVGFTTDGLQLTAATAPDEAVNLIAVLFGGADLDAQVNVHNFASTDTSKSVSGLAWTPNLLIAISSNAQAADATVANGSISIGIAKSAASQYCFDYYSDSGVTTVDVQAKIHTDAIASRPTASQTFAISAIASDGYTLTRTGSNGAGDVIVLAMSVAGASIALGTQDLPGATGSQGYSLGFDTRLAVAIATLLTSAGALATDTNASGWGVGAWTDVAAFAMGMTDEDANTTTDTEATYGEAAILVRQTVGSDSYLATETSMASPGPTLNYTAALGAARKMIMLGIEATINASITPDFSADTTTPTVGDTVTFTDATVDVNTTSTEWAWNFGDGSSSTLQNPTHVYTVAGVYTVTLVSGDGAIAGTKIRADYITVAAAAATPPTLALIRGVGTFQPDPLTAPILAGAVVA